MKLGHCKVLVSLDLKNAHNAFNRRKAQEALEKALLQILVCSLLYLLIMPSAVSTIRFMSARLRRTEAYVSFVRAVLAVVKETP